MVDEKTNILIADDHQPFRIGLRALLATVPEFNIVGEATTGEEVVRMAITLQPDIILMDLQMPDLTGIEATRRILATSPHIGVVVLTMFEDDDSVFAALRAGARGYLLKGALRADILRAIRSVINGEAILGASIAKRLMSFFSAAPPTSPSPYAFPELTLREREILDLIARHLSNQEIATRLDLTLKTVRNHVSNIFSKMQVVDRVQAILLAKKRGIGEKDQGPT
jgi:DNA-binding NarL/FixJ family response regulator